MSRWMMICVAGMLALATSCGAPASQPATNATATPAPAATAMPTIAATETPAPAATTAPTAASTATTNSTPTGGVTAATAEATTAASASGGQTTGDFVPKVRSVWDTAVGLDQMSGACSKGSLLPVYGLVQITPSGDTLAWKNQEPAPYTMKRLQPNEYQYAGPTAIKDGVVTMTVTFIDAKSLQMNREFVANADPGCMHTNVYTGTFQWEKP
ncbi:MAG: hypothetical protein M1434_11320 [Chloroflexi bacterium]|nr:hypothetical protein [Chloroflexota bacterium]MCL5275312.1 hypothetical protein [Chloroflexota bacterium]